MGTSTLLPYLETSITVNNENLTVSHCTVWETS